MNRLASVAVVFLGIAGLLGEGGAAAAAEATVGALRIDNIWARASIGGSTGAFLSIHNDGDADRLRSVSSRATPDVQVHATVKDGDVMKMRQVDGLDVPAHGSVDLQPGGYHIMVMGLTAPLKVGDQLPLTLHFDKAGAVDVLATVQKAGAPAPAHDPGDHGMNDHQHMH
ncbi:copper chaperone PCu(A)C [Telmatospirillum sp.]|uniref:copper chaperone PCu(A)C n=1 Tax=Telmatospirillum sp. TaxID=2079197 RepID=UPI00284DA0C0|nr:copper chaperone PCu(A)C [Telmatospirillum sp.]MDR3437760.1 copper chaperone PCu(A)C [Telmatospirillum sp.]